MEHTEALRLLLKREEEIEGLKTQLKEKEKKIAELETKVKDKNEKLHMSLDMWSYLSHEINSSLMQANPLFYAMLNESRKD